jgi:ATP-dependent exoDNAse (exonuclease V) beta subunit
MTQVHNAIIRASAGSGKTFQLVRRYLRLLALGEAPEHIVAMTFTRKAAREFFERILQKLAELADDPSKAKGYLDELAVPGVALALLRKVIRAMDRLRLGTIDSFFASVTRCFPFELGLSGQAAIMPEEETLRARAEVMSALLVDITREGDGTALKEMLEAWKRATAGRELNRPTAYLDAWFNSLHDTYLESPGESFWGSREVIWPDRAASVWLEDPTLEKAVDRLQEMLDVSIFGKGAEAKWEQFFVEVRARRPGEPIKVNSALDYMLSEERLPIAHLPLLRQGGAKWAMFRKQPELGLPLGAALADVLDLLVGRELMCRVHRTQGRRSVVARFDAQYERRVRGRGRLAFADLTWLLAGRIHALRGKDDGDSQERWETMRRDWEYRLDGRFHHWLFDEFQDTSRRQWDVVASLVDEAASDPEGRRSFFAVGDLKQSLYLWRQAEPELFLDVETRYAKVRMEPQAPLVTSHRSCPEVLAMVNAVFNDGDLLAEKFPDAMRWWSFDAHDASEKTKKLAGHSALISAPEDKDTDAKESRDSLVTALIRRIAPLDRGLSCAVLVRSNDEAARLSAELRRRLHVEVVCESQVPVALDNPVTLALLSVFKLAVHPGDTSAEWHLRMSPLAGWIAAQGAPAVVRLGAEVRRSVARDGFLATSRLWAERLREGAGEWDAFSAQRLAQFFDIAAEFDDGGSRDVDAFLDFARAFRVRASERGRALQVMTVHKAKGLEFDVVIMPHLQNTALDQPLNPRDGESLLIQRDERGTLQWLLDKPPSLLCARDARLSTAVRQEKARLAYQGLCRLYVGMTRAIRALYLILPEKGNQRSEVDLLKCALATKPSIPWEIEDTIASCWHETGDRDWFEGIVDRTIVPSSKEPLHFQEKLGVLLRKAGKHLQRRAPSGEESFRIRGADLLSERREAARRFGTLVHELFEAVPWLDGLNESEIRGAWNLRGMDAEVGFDTAAARVLACLGSSDVRAWFELGGRPREAWCERSFDMLLDREWISGTFDRVVVERDAQGRATAATLLDFKTDAVPAPEDRIRRVEGYAPQMKLYIKAVCRLTGLPAEKVTAGFIFTTVGELHWLEHQGPPLKKNR